MKPLVSVVIPTYNRARWIAEAVDSVISQTFTDYEIIVVDDGSRDDTRSALAPYQSNISYYYQDNAGCSAARNRGIAEARGEWLSFLDSDDVWMKGKLERQLSDIERFPQTKAHAINALIYRDHIGREVDLFEYIGFRARLTEDPMLIERPLLQQIEYGFGWPQSVLVRRDVMLKTSLFDPSLRLWQDMDLFYRIAAEGRWCVNGEPMIRIMRREEDASLNLSSQSERNPLQSWREMLTLYERLSGNSSIDEREAREARSRHSNAASSLGIEYLRSGDRASARRFLMRGLAIRNGPTALAKALLSFLPAPLALGMIDAWRRRRRGLA